MKRLMITLGLMFAISAPAGPSYAQTPAPAPVNDPILSLRRLSIAAGLEREVLRELTGDKANFGVLALGYNVWSPQPGAAGSRLALTARFAQCFDADERPEGRIGIRYTLFQGAK